MCPTVKSPQRRLFAMFRLILVRLTNLNRGYNLRNDEMDLALPKPKTNFLKRSFKHSASMLWNNFSMEAKTATSLR